MSKEVSIEDLKTTGKVDMVQQNLQATLQREKEEAEAAEAARLEALEKEKREDGRQYEMEVEGFNIGDSLVRRMQTLQKNGNDLAEALADQDIEADIEGDEAVTTGNWAPAEEKEVDIEDEIMDEVDDEPTATEPVKPSVKVVKPVEEKVEDAMPTQADMKIDDSDFDDIDLDIESTDEVTAEEENEILRPQLDDKLGLVDKFEGAVSISKEPVTLNSILGSLQKKSDRVVDWPLISSGTLVSMKQFTGAEIESLNGNNGSRNRYNALRDIYKVIYDHIVSEKPDFDKWLKVTPFTDIEHLYMAIYKASFFDANYITNNCPSGTCKKVFLSDNIDIMDMVKFKDTEAKTRFNSIMNHTDKDMNKLYDTTIVPIYGDLGIGFREPSIYNTIFENSILDDAFVDKYRKLLMVMVYIDGMYLKKDGKWFPLKVKTDANSELKTIKYRIATYTKIINALPSDGYQKIANVINKINLVSDAVTYQIPEMTCPHCKTTIPAVDMSAQRLVFMRHQLNLDSL